MRKELTKSYLKENFPRKPYLKTHFVLRNRRPGELYWSEILALIFVAFVFILLVMNYFYTNSPQNNKQMNKTDDTKVINVGASVEKKLDSCKMTIRTQKIIKGNL